jgi:antirestriction protein
MSTYPTNTDDVIDSRDVRHAIEDLTALRDDADFTEDDAEDLAALTNLAQQGEDAAADWHYGEQLIRDSYFADYAHELADDIGAVPDNLAWPLTCIDWEQAARELRMDYTPVEFDGVTYWTR